MVKYELDHSSCPFKDNPFSIFLVVTLRWVLPFYCARKISSHEWELSDCPVMDIQTNGWTLDI